MALLAIGILCLLGTWRILGRRPSRLTLADGLWPIAMALIGLAQVTLGAGALPRYHLTLLGLRFRVVDEARVLPTTVALGGDYDSTDVNVRGTGAQPVAFLRAIGDSSARAVVLSVPDAPRSVSLTREGRRWNVVGGRRVRRGDTVTVTLADTTYRLQIVGERAAGLRGRVGISDDAVIAYAPAHTASQSVRLNPVTRSVRDRLRGGRRANVFERAYPLADVMTALVETRSTDVPVVPQLASFFYYQDGDLYLADLDPEVGDPKLVQADTVWEAESGGKQIMFAGLPYRDVTSLDEPPPARGGIRSLFVGSVTVDGPWLRVTSSSPEIISLDRRALCGVSQSMGCERSETPYRIRFSGARQSVLRNAVAFDLPPKRFEAASQAVFELPRDPTSSVFRLLTPGGRASVMTGQPFGVGDNDRQAIVRVDGKGRSFGFAAALLVLLLLPTGVFLLRPMRPLVFAIALTTFGFTLLRLALGMGAAMDYPFVQKALQTSLWLVLALPWIVIALGTARERDRSLVTRIIHALYAIVASAVAWLLMPDSTAVRLVLTGLSLTVAAVHLYGSAPTSRVAALWRRSVERVPRWIAATSRRIVSFIAFVPRLAVRLLTTLPFVAAIAPYVAVGLRYALPLLALRVALYFRQWHEAITIGGTRVAISTVYTPLCLVMFVLMLRRSYERARDQNGGMSLVAFNAWVFIAIAYGAVAAIVSDTGIALVTAVAPLVFLHAMASRWVGDGRAGAGQRLRSVAQRLAFAFPLALFIVLQLRAEIALDRTAPLYSAERWDANTLRLLGHTDPDALATIGLRQSEALGVMYETMRGYTTGKGMGFLRNDVSGELRTTAAREHVVSALLAGQWGLFGPLALLGLVGAVALAASRIVPRARSIQEHVSWMEWPGTLLTGAIAVLLALSFPFGLLPGLGALLACVVIPAITVFGIARMSDRPSRDAGATVAEVPVERSIASLFLATVACSGVYMILANYGRVAFTGKNVYVLGLDSISDILESAVLLGGAAWLVIGRRAQSKGKVS